MASVRWLFLPTFSVHTEKVGAPRTAETVRAKCVIKQSFKYIYKHSNTIALQMPILIAGGLQIRQSDSEQQTRTV